LAHEGVTRGGKGCGRGGSYPDPPMRRYRMRGSVGTGQIAKSGKERGRQGREEEGERVLKIAGGGFRRA